MVLRCIACSVVLVLTACATPAPYQPARIEDLDEMGYLDHQVAPDEYAIAFLANCHTSRRRTFDFAFLRAAELGVHNGYRYFSIVRRREDTTTIVTGGTTYVFPVGRGVVANTDVNRSVCPSFTLLVRYYRERPNRGVDLIKCGETATLLADRYGVALTF